MLRYKNGTAAPIQWNGLSWGAGYEADSAIFCHERALLAIIDAAGTLEDLEAVTW